MHSLHDKIRHFQGHFNDGSQAFVVPAFQTLSEQAAHDIGKHGFQAVNTTGNGGQYGEGLYFTSNVHYAAKCAKEDVGDSNGGGVLLLLSLVLPGDVYPATESPDRQENGPPLKGLGCRVGYQSHYVVIDRATGLPTSREGDLGDRDPEDGKHRTWRAGELVVFEVSRVLPLFLVRYNAPARVRRDAKFDQPVRVEHHHLRG